MKKSLLLLTLTLAGIANAQSPRMSLYEEFTGENCPPCAYYNPGLNNMLLSPLNATRCIAIKWQVAIPSAPTTTWSLYQTNKAEINWRANTYGYGINSAPQGRMDGQDLTVFNASSDHPADLTNTIIGTAASYTSAFNITVNRAWNSNCSAITLTVNVNATANFTGGNMILRTVMVERVINFATAPGTNGEKDFYDAVIKSYPTIQNGISIPNNWTNGQSATYTLNCPIPSYCRKKEQIAFVVFIQDDSNKKVAQAARSSQDPLPSMEMGITGAKAKVTCGNTLTPEVTFENRSTASVNNVTIYPYIDGVAAAPQVWANTLAAGGSTTVVLSALNSPTANGGHLFTFDINVPNSPYNLTQNTNRAGFMIANSYNSTSVVESFTLGSFPYTGWAVINDDNGPSFARISGVGAGTITPLTSLKYDAFNNTNVGDMDEFYLPPMDLSGGSDPKISYDVAYAQRNSNSNDGLEVFASSDCGQTWISVDQAAGSNLAANSQYVPYAYTPAPGDDSQWMTREVQLPGMNKSNVLVKFVVTNNNGNNVYVDNINLRQENPTGIAHNSMSAGVSLFPNPSSGVTSLNITVNKAQFATVNVVNMLGQTVMNKTVSLNGGSNDSQIDVSSLTNGVYNVVVITENGKTVKKLNVAH